MSCSVPSCAIYYATFETLRRQAYEYCETHPRCVAVRRSEQQMGSLRPCRHQQLRTDRIRTQYWAKYVSSMIHSRSRSQSIRNLLHDTMEEARSRGVSSLYHGLRPLLLRDICFSSVYWTVYEQLHSVTASLGVPIIFQNLIAASVGGMLTSATVTPFDLVKTRQQVLRTTEPIFTTMKMIYKEEGVHGLFRGLTPRIAQTIPSMSVMMIVYDSLNRFILRRQSSICVDLLHVCYKHRYDRGGRMCSIALHLGQTYLCDFSANERTCSSGVSIEPMAPGVGTGNMLMMAWRIVSTRRYQRAEYGHVHEGTHSSL